jgi:hypothetical protein
MNTATIIVKGVEANHAVTSAELGTVVRTIVREHVAREDRGGWSASMVQSWNQRHGSHVVVTFLGLSRPLDPQRALIQV